MGILVHVGMLAMMAVERVESSDWTGRNEEEKRELEVAQTTVRASVCYVTVGSEVKSSINIPGPWSGLWAEGLSAGH